MRRETYSAQTARSKSSLWCAYDYAHTTAHTTCRMSVCFPDFFFLFMIWFDQRNVNPPKFKERQLTNAITRNYLFFPLLVIAFSVKTIDTENPVCNSLLHFVTVTPEEITNWHYILPLWSESLLPVLLRISPECPSPEEAEIHSEARHSKYASANMCGFLS